MSENTYVVFPFPIHLHLHERSSISCYHFFCWDADACYCMLSPATYCTRSSKQKVSLMTCQIEQEVEKIFISRKHNKPYHNQNRIFSPTDTTTSSYYLLITNKLAHKHSSNNMKFMPLSLNVFLLLGVGAISCSWARSEVSSLK